MRKILIAHRGASAYAPENTLPAYRLAIEQGADYVEQDLQITRDGVLVCLHDVTLERTTDAARVYPERARKEQVGGKEVRRWLAVDFTLEEIKRLDAGAWFGEKFRGTRVPTWQEAIETLRGKAGLYPELKAPELYGKYGFRMEELVWEALRRNGLDKPAADPRTPVILQSFSAEALKNMRELGCKLPMTFLVSRGGEGRWLTAEGLREVRSFATGIGPEKSLVLSDPGVVRRAHELGLTVTVYTFRSADTGAFADVRSEMAYYLYKLCVDAVFTDNPDQFPRQA
ncbi:MAG: glycerophosphodiester phosphodiesterase family protein [Bryobacteraceae bacterium]